MKSVNQNVNETPKIRMNLSDAVLDVSPPPPKCFLNRASWVEYLQSAASSQNQRSEPKVILIVNGQPAMNPKFPFCVDCTQVKSVEMMKQSRCDPAYLVNLYAATEASA